MTEPFKNESAHINYRLHVPIILLLVAVYFFIPTIANKYYKSLVLGKLRNSSKVNGVFRFGEYTPLNKEIAPKKYQFVKILKDGSETIENYYESEGHVTKAIYQNGDWRLSESRSYKEDYLLIWPVVGFIFMGFAALSRTFRLLFNAKVSQYLWNEYDFWRYPFKRVEKIALVYGLPLFIAGFFSGLTT